MKYKKCQWVKVRSPYDEKERYLNGVIIGVLEFAKKYRISFNYESVDCVDSFSESEVTGA